VLEHIEPDFLDNVLDDLAAVTVGYGFYSIHTGPARKHLADGRNAHLIQKPSSWWLPRLCERFEVEGLRPTPGGFSVSGQAESGRLTALRIHPRRAHVSARDQTPHE
jgi:hypothetical protein